MKPFIAPSERVIVCPDEISYQNAIQECEDRGFAIIEKDDNLFCLAIDDPEGKY